jgi:proline iminopeptidase
MDPGHMQMIAQTVGKGRFLLCQNGSHMAMYDDQETYFAGLTTFLRDVDTGAF